MDSLKFSNAIDRMLEAVPSIQQFYNSRVGEIYADGLQYVVYESIFVEYVRALANLLGGPSGTTAEEDLTRAFCLIEELLTSEDYDVRILGEVGVVEALVLGGGVRLVPLERFMGPQTQQMVKKAAQHRRTPYC